MIAIALLLTALALAPDKAAGSKGVFEGVPPLTMDLSVSDKVDESGRWTLGVQTSSREGLGSELASAEIDVAGAEVVEGQKSAVIPAKSGFWRLTLQRTGSGPVLITGSLRVEGRAPGHYYETKDVLQVGFEERDVMVLQKRTVLGIMVQGEKRFRYGGWFLVALDEGERGEMPEILTAPEVISQPEIQCKACPIHGSLEIPVVVTVGRAGSVTWLRPGVENLDRRLWDAVAGGIRTYRFRPAVGRGGPVSESMLLRVRVVPGD